MSRRIPDFDADNRVAAHLILNNVVKHGGPDALVVRWARLWLERHGAATDGRQTEAGQASFEFQERKAA